jgi:hypothetical protein
MNQTVSTDITHTSAVSTTCPVPPLQNNCTMRDYCRSRALATRLRRQLKTFLASSLSVGLPGQGRLRSLFKGKPSSLTDLDVMCLTTGWTTGRSGFDPRQGQRIFPPTSVSRPALVPTQPPVQWVPGILSPGVKRGRDVMLTTHPHLIPRSWMSRSYTSSPPSASMACSGTALLL